MCGVGRDHQPTQTKQADAHRHTQTHTDTQHTRIHMHTHTCTHTYTQPPCLPSSIHPPTHSLVDAEAVGGVDERTAALRCLCKGDARVEHRAAEGHLVEGAGRQRG